MFLKFILTIRHEASHASHEKKWSETAYRWCGRIVVMCMALRFYLFIHFTTSHLASLTFRAENMFSVPK